MKRMVAFLLVVLSVVAFATTVSARARGEWVWIRLFSRTLPQIQMLDQ